MSMDEVNKKFAVANLAFFRLKSELWWNINSYYKCATEFQNMYQGKREASKNVRVSHLMDDI